MSNLKKSRAPGPPANGTRHALRTHLHALLGIITEGSARRRPDVSGNQRTRIIGVRHAPDTDNEAELPIVVALLLLSKDYE